MNISVFKKQTWSLAVLLLTAGLFVSCGKDKDNDNPDPGPGGYPKEVTITYKVTSTNITHCRIDWFNATGGMTMEQNAALPITRTFKKTVNQYETVSFTTASATGGTMKLEILVNDKVVKSQDASGTSGVAGSLTYIFP